MNTTKLGMACYLVGSALVLARDNEGGDWPMMQELLAGLSKLLDCAAADKATRDDVALPDDVNRVSA